MRGYAGVREWLRALLRGDRARAETRQEMQFHLEMEAERRMREGVDATEARRQAALSFGGVDRHAEAVREARGLAWASGLSLDVRLGGRMLRKYPGLTLAGVLALTIAVALAASWFEFLADLTNPRLGFEEADRIVVVQTWDRADAATVPGRLHDFEEWRGSVSTIGELSAVAPVDLAVATDDGRFMSANGARITATGLRLVRVQPQLGRLLQESDEAAGAPMAVVISHRLWQELYDGAPTAIGGTIHLGDASGTVVGVMPEGFGFPVNQDVWVPLRDRASAFERGRGPPVVVFGRLAERTRLAEANAELAALGERAAVGSPATSGHLRPRVVPFSKMIPMPPLAPLLNIPLVLFLVVVCANIATLVFARTVTRTGEIAVRSALGASRRRLVLQLMAEALVLTMVSAAAGLAVAQYGMRRGMALFFEVQQSQPPFWFDDALSAHTILYALALAVLAAAIIGGIPALKATGRSLRSRIADTTPGGSGLRFGRVSTGVIVVQVALCVAFLPVAVMASRGLLPDRASGTMFPAHEFLSGRVTLQVEQLTGGTAMPDSADRARVAAVFAELKTRLESEPGVIEASFASWLPGINHGVEPLQLEADTIKPRDVRTLAVDASWFDVVNATIITGRDFAPAEYAHDAGVVIVDEEWASEEMPGRSPVGQRVRFPRREGENETRWYDIVGVVAGTVRAVGPGSEVGIFEPLRPGAVASQQVYLRTEPAPATMLRQIHSAIAGVDPSLS
jgi:putative ABC transport system permease protein